MTTGPRHLSGGSLVGAVSFALLAALLAGCTDPANPASGAKTSTSAPQEGGGAGLDATSIEGSVADAEAILKDLDQEFQQDNNE